MSQPPTCPLPGCQQPLEAVVGPPSWPPWRCGGVGRHEPRGFWPAELGEAARFGPNGELPTVAARRVALLAADDLAAAEEAGTSLLADHLELDALPPAAAAALEAVDPARLPPATAAALKARRKGGRRG